MKPLNFLLIVFVAAVVGGLIFSKNKITNNQRPQVPNYLDYSEQNFALAKNSGRTVLFFAATTWCSNCKAIDEEIKKRNAELPKDITILKVDYDHDREMKTKYNVAMQTTLILLDKDGREEKRWIGTDFSDLIQNIN